jgi:hypothetical protein
MWWLVFAAFLALLACCACVVSVCVSGGAVALSSSKSAGTAVADGTTGTGTAGNGTTGNGTAADGTTGNGTTGNGTTGNGTAGTGTGPAVPWASLVSPVSRPPPSADTAAATPAKLNVKAIMSECSAATGAPAPQSGKVSKSSALTAQVIPGQRTRMVYRDPLPTYTKDAKRTTRQLSQGSLVRSMCGVERLYSALCMDFPELKCGGHGNAVLDLTASDNVKELGVVVPPGVGAFANAYKIIYAPDVLDDSAGDLLLGTSGHELGHVVFGPYYAFEESWGRALGETFGEFSTAWLFPENEGIYYHIKNYFTNKSHKNPYSKEALDYGATGRAYNGIIWMFFVARYGRAAFVKMLTAGTVQNVRGKGTLLEIVANAMSVPVNAFAGVWLADLLTMGFFRDGGVREGKARAVSLRNKTHDKAMVWAAFRNADLAYNAAGSEWTCGKVGLEAFGFMAYDLRKMLFTDAKLVNGAGAKLRVAATPARAGDDLAWVMVLVAGGKVSDATVVVGNEVSIAKASSAGPLVLAVMHTKGMAGNDAAPSAVGHKISLVRT